MAKVQIEIDTEAKTTSVKVGKTQLDNVTDIWISTEDGGYFSLDISQREEMEGLKKRTSLYASASDAEWQEKEDKTEATQAALAAELSQALGRDD